MAPSLVVQSHDQSHMQKNGTHNHLPHAKVFGNNWIRPGYEARAKTEPHPQQLTLLLVGGNPGRCGQGQHRGIKACSLGTRL